MPSVCALIDGTLVNIEAPHQHEEQYVDRKGNHSLNVLLACGPEYQFYFCNSMWPGSVNDSRVLKNSSLWTAFQNLNFRPFPGSILLGDSIYPCNNWLLTPIRGDNLNISSTRYNYAHKKTRCLIERAIGILKNRFPVLKCVRVKNPAFAAEIIKSCVALHNLCLANNDYDEEINANFPSESDTGEEYQQHNEIGLRRNEIVSFFDS